MKMSYLDVSKIRICKVLEDNYDIILDEYQKFNFNLTINSSLDRNWELWREANGEVVKQSKEDDTSDTDWDTVVVEPYKKSHSWYGLNVDGTSIWDGAVIAVRDRSGLHPTPIGEEFFTKTFAIMKRYKEVSDIAIARFSANQFIPLHKGYPMLNRVHMGLIVPEGDITFCVGGEKRKWEERKCLAFNDGSEHTAWNNTDIDRVVMIVDVIA